MYTILTITYNKSHNIISLRANNRCISLWGDGSSERGTETERECPLVCTPLFYNPLRVRGGWLLHGCPQHSVTSKNLMCVSWHQGPPAASMSVIWCCGCVSPLLAARCQEGAVWGSLHKSSYAGYRKQGFNYCQFLRCIFWLLVACTIGVLLRVRSAGLQ